MPYPELGPEGLKLIVGVTTTETESENLVSKGWGSGTWL